MKTGARFVVKGTVQGVFFRRFVKENADELGLRGFCRNLDNGDVEIVVEGEDEAIKRLGNCVREGPKYAQIRNVVFEERKWGGDFGEFKVLRF